MIHRIVIPLLLIILLPDCYRAWRNSCRKVKKPLWQRTLRWIPSVLMAVSTCLLACSKGFLPEKDWTISLYLWVLGVYFIPRFALRLCMAIGRLFRPLSKKRRNWGRPVGLLLALTSLYIFIYGMTLGPRQLTVKQMEMTFGNLPDAFDGYRLVVISDLHLGSAQTAFVERVISTINDQQPDAVCFLGDIQNTEPQELYPYTTLLHSFEARNGVISVLGNHDYSYYVSYKDDAVKAANERETVARERQAGWTVLMNESRRVERHQQYIYFVGTENYSDQPQRQPSTADIEKAMDGVPADAFVILLQHNPLFWRAEVSRQTDIPLTLCGHTHGGQMSFFGLRPSMKQYSEDCGLYTQGHQRLFVTTGLGGLILFRFNMPPEIVIITLRKSK